MKRFRTLHATIVVLVFMIMVMAGLVSVLSLSVLRRLHMFQSILNAAQLLPIAMLVASVIIGTLIAFFVSHRVLRPVDQLIEATRAVGKGDFSVRLPATQYEPESELGELLQSFNLMVEELGSIEMFRSDFINTFSHEFKTPIVSIRGFARQLQRKDLTDQERQEYTDIIVFESERLTDMAANILLLSKFENQQVIGDKTEYYLDEQLRNCILRLEKQWSEKALHLDVELEPICYLNNEEMLSHVWSNILDNAVKFTPENGTITVRAFLRGENAVVQVRDTGVGMDQETLNHIFDKFYQGDSAHLSVGNGLGLPLVKRIVQLSGGRILVESQKDTGTTFTVTLPMQS